MISSERAIIGSLLVDNKAIRSIYGFIKPEMFSEGLCKEAYEIIVQMYDMGEKITVLDLMNRLENELRPQDEIKQFLMECANSVESSDKIKQYGNLLLDEYRANGLKEAVSKLSFLPRNSKKEISDLITTCEALKINEKPRYKTLSQLAREIQGEYFKDHDTGIRTGFYELDEIIVGLEKKDVTILGARPAVGKSVFALQLALNVAEKGFRVAIFNLEMSNNQIFERIISSKSGIELMRLRKAKSFVNNEENDFKKAVKKVESMNNLYLFSGSYSANEIRSNCRNQHFDLVVIDYLQLVKPDRNYGNRVSEVGDISKGIKAMAMELDVPVLALSQLNRSKKATDEPEMADLRESGDIEQDASTILFMWNMEEDGRTKGMKVAKNRQGNLGKIGFDFIGQNMSFRSIQKKFNEVEADVRRHEQYAREMRQEDNPFEDM